MVGEGQETMVLVESAGSIILGLDDHCQGTDLPADGKAADRRVQEQQSTQALAPVPPVHGQATQQNSRQALIAGQSPCEFGRKTLGKDGESAKR